MIVGALSVISLIAYSNSSYMWTRLLFFLGPFVLFLGAVRAGFAIFRLNYCECWIRERRAMELTSRFGDDDGVGEQIKATL